MSQTGRVYEPSLCRDSSRRAAAPARSSGRRGARQGPSVLTRSRGRTSGRSRAAASRQAATVPWRPGALESRAGRLCQSGGRSGGRATAGGHRVILPDPVAPCAGPALWGRRGPVLHAQVRGDSARKAHYDLAHVARCLPLQPDLPLPTLGVAGWMEEASWIRCQIVGLQILFLGARPPADAGECR
jgi:hypothetical protein